MGSDIPFKRDRIYDLDLLSDAWDYLLMWESAGLLTFEDDQESIYDLDDDEVIQVAKELFMKGDERMPTRVLQ